MAVTLLKVTAVGAPKTDTVLEGLVIVKPVFATATVRVLVLKVPLIAKVYVGPEPLRVPFVTLLNPLRVISLALSPAIAWLKVRVN